MGPGDDRMAWERTEQDTGQMGRETDSNIDDDGRSTTTEQSDIKKMPPPNRQSNSSTPAKEGSGKFSFAFKKAAPPTAPKPVPDLAQRMRDPPKPIDLQQRSQPRAPLAMRTKQDRDYRRDDKKDARARHERYYESSRSDRNDRRDESRRRDRREERRDDRMSDSGYERRQREPTPEKPKAKIIVKRTKKRPELSEEYASSTSVYFRKPGNESVIGAGTYGKVFKAVHVYTEQQVALKKIRMEGEKDGFPITAVREIRLLQYLRHDNI
ncbi:Cyclin-dependent kinase 12, partial [Ascosphaera atra]